MRKTKDQVAKELAEEHSRVEPSIVKIIRFTGGNEQAPTEPIKLLEVSRDTIPDGIVPVSFGPDSEVPYPLVVIDVTPDEFKAVRSRKLKLPRGWRGGRILFEQKA